MHKILTKITEEEGNEIEALFEKLNSLESLKLSYEESSNLLKDSSQYENVINDILVTKKGYTDWWERVVIKYSLEKHDIGKVYVDFAKNEIGVR